MTRLGFRVSIDSPRPLAAYGMVLTASATLVLTGQVAPWAILVSTALGLIAFLRRRAPFGLQRNPLVLNAGLGFAAAASAALWARGEIALIALAHFAMLAAGLQLLDARPRRSEFLLVALALFQVILAANLTDSLWFPPFLVAFSISTVWTLLVHTMRAEAMEDGRPDAAHAALTPRLFSVTLLGTLLAMLLALSLFPVLPRVRSGAFLQAGLGGGLGVSGFSDRVELGDLGRIRMDPAVALRVETVRGEAPSTGEGYWRGLAFDQFDGRVWSVSGDRRERVTGSAEIGVALGAAPRGARLEQRIVREPVTAGVVFAPGEPLRLQGAVGRVERDRNGGIYAYRTAHERIAYTIVTDARRPAPEALAGDRASVPAGTGNRYLTLPTLAPRVRALAHEITADASSDFARARALELHLRRTGRYTDEPPSLGEGDAAIERFLFEGREGHCEYFASSMVVLARTVGLPTRLVNGFAGGEPNALGGFVELRRADAHTWVEVHFRGSGWVRFDPTPPDLRLAGARAFSARDRMAAFQSALEYWWFKNVIDFDRSRQARALRSVWHRWHQWRTAQPAEEPSASPRPGLPGFSLGIAGPALLTLAALAALVAASRRRARRDPVPRFYRAALRLVERRAGLAREAATSARDYVGRVAAGLGPEAAVAFSELTETYLRARFGAGVGAEDGSRALARLRDSLRA